MGHPIYTLSDSECFEFFQYPMANCNSCSKILFWPPCSRSSPFSIIILNLLKLHTCNCMLTLYIAIKEYSVSINNPTSAYFTG